MEETDAGLKSVMSFTELPETSDIPSMLFTFLQIRHFISVYQNH